MRKTKKTIRPKSQPATSNFPGQKLPLREHLRELKRRFIWIAITVGVGSIAAYAAEHQLIKVLLKPSAGQEFIYTSPLGGMNFLFGVCFQLGLVAATPVIIYNVLAFLKPLMRHTTHRFLVLASFAATVTAAAGVVFGYFVGLPSALHFLLHQFTTVQVKPLITIQSYMSFVAVYLLGSALMFQLPLLILFINRIKPLKPSHLLKYERHAIVGSFIVAFIMNPTPNVLDQMLVVVPVLLMYQLSILMLWFIRRHDVPDLSGLLHTDAVRQTKRLETAAEAVPGTLVELHSEPAPIPSATSFPPRAGRTFDIVAPRRTQYQTIRPSRLVQ